MTYFYHSIVAESKRTVSVNFTPLIYNRRIRLRARIKFESLLRVRRNGYTASETTGPRADTI